jgi:hypothetical protein
VRSKVRSFAGMMLIRLQAGRVHPAFIGSRWARLCRTAATQWKRLSLTSERLWVLGNRVMEYQHHDA